MPAAAPEVGVTVTEPVVVVADSSKDAGLTATGALPTATDTDTVPVRPTILVKESVDCWPVVEPPAKDRGPDAEIWKSVAVEDTVIVKAATG